MHEYEKKNAYKGVQQNSEPIHSESTNGIPNSAMQDVMAGKAHATSEMMGHKQNLAPSIAAKMSQAFGMDLSGMQVYRSDAMAGSGMEGLASGNKVVLSSDVDLNTTAGQAVLGHEISHIHAQSQGIGMGNSGLYENAALEHQADTEGLLAAQGKSIYQSGGMDMGGGMQYGLGMQGVEGMTTLGGGMSASAGAPMQAKKGGKGGGGGGAAQSKLSDLTDDEIMARDDFKGMYEDAYKANYKLTSKDQLESWQKEDLNRKALSRWRSTQEKKEAAAAEEEEKKKAAAAAQKEKPKAEKKPKMSPEELAAFQMQNKLKNRRAKLEHWERLKNTAGGLGHTNKGDIIDAEDMFTAEALPGDEGAELVARYQALRKFVEDS